MKKVFIALVSISVVFSTAVSVNAFQHPPTIKVFNENELSPVVDEWSCVRFENIDEETLFDNCATLIQTDNESHLRINKPGFYTIGGSVNIEISGSADKENIQVLIKAVKNGTDVLRETQRELFQEIFKSHHEISLSFTGVEKFERGDNIALCYYVNDSAVIFKSDDDFTEPIACALSLSRLSKERPPQKIETSSNSGGNLAIVLSFLAVSLSLLLIISRKGGGF